MAGTNAGFDAAAFRDAIHFAMKMGSTTNAADKATFRWTVARTYATADSGGSPFDFTATPTVEVTHPDVVLDNVAIDFTARPAATVESSVGQFDNPRVAITLLDEEYELVEGADQVLLGGETYVLKFVAPPQALFSVDVYTLYFEALDEV